MNHGDRAVIGVFGEVWNKGADLDGTPTVSEGPSVILPNAAEPYLFLLTMAERNAPIPEIAAWQVRWTDADGCRWCLDRQPQDAPDVFTGQAPTPY